ncbi:MAG: hypothetical protein A2Y54_04740 [Chloroflexi bacterium RBG_16_51_16]|nr:MAG: hypothetical protein A2Y54_04740 [Chloroflexi bacterium RBG_16_51_16]
MKLPIGWLKDFIKIDGLSVEDIARMLTLAGLEVEEIIYAGLPLPKSKVAATDSESKHEFKTSGIGWDKDKIVVGEIYSVDPHPNADRLVLCDLFDGIQQHVVLTGAPNLFEYKGRGKLAKSIKVAYAREAATLYDGHAQGRQLMTLRRTKIRGVESYSMACSEKELGISDEHEGIILLDADAPVGTPLADYMGDAVLDIAILPNMARCASVLGVARELAALTGRKLIQPRIQLKTSGSPVKESVTIKVNEPELNPRFVLGFIRDVEIKPSPYQVQRRLKLAGMRPINCIVDASNYAMLELGQPLHAFDYDVLTDRAGRSVQIKISTRRARAGEQLTTLDGVSRKFNESHVLVCDSKGPLSIAGIMGGAVSEVYDASNKNLDVVNPEDTQMHTEDNQQVIDPKSRQGKASQRIRSTSNVLLEGAAWNFINIRRTAKEHNLPSEASFRFSRGVHPAMAEVGVRRGLQLMAEWSGGKVAPGLVDEYPLKPKNPTVQVSPTDVKRLLGIDLKVGEIARLLSRLEFKCVLTKSAVRVTAPDHRMDIGEGLVGLADVLEEVARVYGYDRIPETRMADKLPPQIGNPIFEWEEHLRDILVAVGFQEVVGYRLTSIERERRVLSPGSRQDPDYAVIANPTTPERSVLRRSLTASVLEALEKNINFRETISLFEIGPIFEPVKNKPPVERSMLAMVLSGRREHTSWDVKDLPWLDFFDLKGRIELILSALRFTPISYADIDTAGFLHPGKSAEVKVGGKTVAVFGEVHPLVKAAYDLSEAPVMAAEFDLQALRSIPSVYGIEPVPDFPAIYEDIALILDESIPASTVESLILEGGGGSVTHARLFDVYQGEQIGLGKKSLAYSLTYQAADRTLTDAEAADIRNAIVKKLEQAVGARLRS